MMITNVHITQALNELLSPQLWKDYAPNGLQVEGKSEIRHLVLGVTASLALIEAAIEEQADGILVHHGLFWRGQTGCITGWMRQRLALLLKHDINVWAYHLPLDAHPNLGNNHQLAQKLGLKPLTSPEYFGDQRLGWVVKSDEKLTLQRLTQKIHQTLNRIPIVIGDENRIINRIGLCTGGAQSSFDAAIQAGVDVFITGELSEPQAHLARETGVAFIAAGHHATERYGVQALGEWLSQKLAITSHFIDIDNPA